MTRSQSTNPQPFTPGSFSEMLGIEEVETREGWARLRISVQTHHLQSANAVHGGVIMALADTAFWRAVSTLLTPQQSAVTSELKVNFTRAARGGHLIAESRVVHKGNLLVVGDTEVTDGHGDLVAKALGTYVIIQQNAGPPE